MGRFTMMFIWNTGHDADIMAYDTWMITIWHKISTLIPSSLAIMKRTLTDNANNLTWANAEMQI